MTILRSDGTECGTGEIGEVALRDDGCVMRGYFGAPPEVRSVDGKGWLHTADLGFPDEEGYLHLAGRIKDIIIKGGENIAPGGIEEKISELPEVREVKVTGAYDEMYGENVEACVTLKLGCTAGFFTIHPHR